MTVVVLRVFISSPSDVQAERERTDIVAERLNVEFKGRAQVEVQHWSDSFFTAVQSFQQAIMASVEGMRGTNMVLCIVWKRAGLELDPAIWRREDGSAFESGTVLEYETARQLSQSHGAPDLYLFRKTAPKDYAEHDVHEQIRQREVLDKVLARWTMTAAGHNASGYQKFNDADDFERQVEGCMRQWLKQHGVSRQAVVWDRVVQGSPFRGLDAFDSTHADVFFGRSTDVARAVAKLQQAEVGGVPFLLLVGASGAGKSSLLRAGLRRQVTTPGTFSNVAVWRSCLVVPGADPLRRLAEALFSPEALGEELGAGDFREPALLARALADPSLALAAIERALERVASKHARARQLGAPRPARLLVCIDQLERLLLEVDRAQADAFSRVLRELVERRRVSAIAALRSDTYARFLQCADLVVLLEKGGGRTYNLLPPSPGDLVDIVYKPVEACKPPLAFEVDAHGQSLSEIIVGDVQGGDALPLLQVTLQSLYAAEQTRGDGVLRRADYRGIGAAVAHAAQAAYSTVDSAAQNELRALLATMVSDVVEDEQGNPVPVVAPVDRAGFERGQASRMALIAALVNSHMLTSEAVGTVVLVRPVHDALLRTWPLASRLIAEHAPFIHMRHTLAPMVEGWHKAGHRDKPEHLATGAFLAGAVALQSKMADVLDADMLAFIEASRAAHSRRRRVRSASLVAGLVVAVGLLQLFSIMQTRDAQAGRLVAEAKGALSQMEHARAEIAAAGALRLRSDKETRQLLLAARLGGVSIVARAAEPVPTTLTVFNPSARLVASVEQVADGQQQAVRVASVTDGRTLWRLPLPAGVRSVDAVAFGPDLGGERPLAVSWSVDGAAGYHVGLWALRDGQNAGLLRELPTDAANGGHTKRIPGLAFHPAQVWLATGGEDGKLALWDVSGAAGRLLWQRERTHEPNIHGIAFSRDGRLLASAGGDYLARVWETAALVDAGIPTAAGAGHKRVAAKYTLSGHRDSVFAVAFNPEGTRLATGGYDRTVRVWDFALATTAAGSGGQPPTIATLSDHDGTIFSIAYSDDGRLLASGASDGSAALWDASTGRLLNRIRPDDGIVRSVSLPRFEGGLHVGGEQGWSVWSVSGNAVIKRLWNGGATVNNVAFDATGKFLAAAGDGDEGRVRVWDASFGAPRVLDPKTEGESINGLAFSPDARWLVAGGSKMQLHVWDRTQRDWPRRAFAEAPSHRDIIWGLCFDAQSRWLASSSQSPGVQIKRWDTQTWRLLDETPPNELQDSIWAIACDGVGNRLISGDSKEVIVVRDANDLQIVDMAPPRHTGELNVWSVAVMQSPHAILSAHADGRVRKWTPMKDAGWRGGLPALDASTTAQAAKVNPTVNSISHDPRHGWVAAGGVGPSVEIYDDKTLTLQRSLRGHSGTIWWVTFNNQGTKLAYGGLDGIVRVVDLDNMLKIDDDKPAALYEASQRATGLTVVDDAIVRSRVGGGASGGSPW